MVDPFDLAWKPVKFLLFDNKITRFLDGAWENVSEVDTSKLSGKQVYDKALSEDEISYLKSITDGYNSKKKDD